MLLPVGLLVVPQSSTTEQTLWITHLMFFDSDGDSLDLNGAEDGFYAIVSTSAYLAVDGC